MEAAYVKKALGTTLTDALSLLAVYRPEDPVEWLADYLRHEDKRQRIIAVKREEQEKRAKILKKAQEEEERLAELKREEERLANLRKPNQFQLDCMAFLQEITELEKKLKNEDKSVQEIGEAVMQESRKSMTHMQLSEEAKALVEEPPKAIQQLIKAGMVISGYPLEKLENWSDISEVVLNDYALTRYETLDVMAVANKHDIKDAVEMVDGIDYLARPVQKHPLGPLATRYHTFVRAALQSFGYEPSQFLSLESVEEDRQTFQRTIWRMPEEVEKVLDLDKDGDTEALREEKKRILSTMAGLDRRVLPKEITSKLMHVEVWWKSAENEETDADASLIMFSEHGQPIDSVYHLVRHSKDNAIKHMGDMGEETDAEYFTFDLPKLAKNVDVIGVVLNVATDGESLEHTEACGIRIYPSTGDTNGGAGGGGADSADKKEEEQEEEAGGDQEKKDDEGEGGGDDKEGGDEEEEEDKKEEEDKAEGDKEDEEDGEDGDEGDEQQSSKPASKKPSMAPPAMVPPKAPPVLTMSLDAHLIDKHEVLMTLLHRDQEDPDLWHIVGVGEQVKGEWREKEESQNFLNALPLGQRYIELLGIRHVDHSGEKVMHPFKMVPGDFLEVPALAVEHPVVIGMGWDVDPDVAMDLDCGLAVYSKGQRTDYCDFEKLVSNDKAIEHQGDNRDGEGEGDDESIIVEFSKLDPETDTLFLYAAVYEGGALRDVENVHIRMLSKRGGKQKEICRFSLDWLAKVEDDTAVILAKISRTPEGAWLFQTIGTTAPGRTIEELESRLTELL
ncbi:hypothetical protein PTSG_02177 [Salpingoeca rosetta]|uniref:TerD domain-containing protein n=1 Tax=Salpingoeca rosetta (strain ATCC 50818 / BSB-021) TaxID=946362 RepID=F2U1F7_SALR5|nr:uncharacterized protein PTSG_02177 [Salpingoeca rosetta]EGD81459.1 hypothetical protein PTSG_02177 [Salpingoeca rosetta]|eukprot:XP_004996663.1 hypothetical protein PTSG_02177 [Salpingoeca rosetta]